MSIKKLIARLLAFDFIRFSIVGTSGFMINSGLLFVLYKKIGIPIFLSQLLASEVSLFSNFIMHNHWTYKHKVTHKTSKELLAQFHLTSWSAIIGSALIVSLLVSRFEMNYLIALVISSVIALFWNFGWTKFVIWKHHDQVIKGDDK